VTMVVTNQAGGRLSAPPELPRVGELRPLDREDFSPFLVARWRTRPVPTHGLMGPPCAVRDVQIDQLGGGALGDTPRLTAGPGGCPPTGRAEHEDRPGALARWFSHPVGRRNRADHKARRTLCPRLCPALETIVSACERFHLNGRRPIEPQPKSFPGEQAERGRWPVSAPPQPRHFQRRRAYPGQGNPGRAQPAAREGARLMNLRGAR